MSSRNAEYNNIHHLSFPSVRQRSPDRLQAGDCSPCSACSGQSSFYSTCWFEFQLQEMNSLKRKAKLGTSASADQAQIYHWADEQVFMSGSACLKSSLLPLELRGRDKSSASALLSESGFSWWQSAKTSRLGGLCAVL